MAAVMITISTFTKVFHEDFQVFSINVTLYINCTAHYVRVPGVLFMLLRHVHSFLAPHYISVSYCST